MKTTQRNIIPRRLFGLLLSVATASCAHAADLHQAASQTETTATVQREKLAFPAKPSHLTATFLVGPPEITIDPTLALKLGGSAITGLVRAPIENLLHNSARFRVSTQAGPYHVRARLSAFSIAQSTGKKKTGLKAFKNVIGRAAKIGPDDPLRAALDAALDADLTREESQMTLRCAVAVQLFGPDGILMAGQAGEVVLKDTTRNIKAEIVGFQYSQDSSDANDPSSQWVQFQSKAIERATYEALLLLMPELDAKLAEGVSESISVTLASAEPPRGSAPSVSSTGGDSSASAGSAKPAYCGNCGHKTSAANKFCTECGHKLDR